jgi:hypothetical protein
MITVTDGNAHPGLGKTQQCGRVKLGTEIQSNLPMTGFPTESLFVWLET